MGNQMRPYPDGTQVWKAGAGLLHHAGIVGLREVYAFFGRRGKAQTLKVLYDGFDGRRADHYYKTKLDEQLAQGYTILTEKMEKQVMKWLPGDSEKNEWTS